MTLKPLDLKRLLPLLYLLICTPVVIANAFIMAPLQAADEESHFLHVVEISRGEIVGERRPGAGTGAEVDTAALDVRSAFLDAKFHKRDHMYEDLVAQNRDTAWNWPSKSFADFANTVIYPPMFYVPAALGLKVSQWFAMPILDGVTLARLFNGFTWLAVSALALRLVESGRFVLFIVLSLPMTLSLYGSCSQDGGVVSVTALATAILTRRDALGAKAKGAVALALGSVIAARLPYFPLAGAALLPALRSDSSGGPAWRRVARGLVWPALALLVAVVWYVVGFRHLGAAVPTDANISPAAQVRYLLEHPFAIFGVVAETLRLWFVEFVHQFIGILGSLDVTFSPESYVFYECGLLFAFAYTMVCEPAAWTWSGKALTAVVVLATCAAVGGSLYLVWTVVGQGSIDGIQGRYFIAPVLLLGPAFALRRVGAPTGAVAERVAVSAFTAFAAYDLWVVPHALMLRYW